MSYLGGYLGLIETIDSGGGSGSVAGASNPGNTVAIASPYTPADPEYVDHLSLALSRLCQYAKDEG